MRLTEPQLLELRRLSKGPQNTYGKSRARVQNKLADMKLAAFVDEHGSKLVFTLKNLTVPSAGIADKCIITELGRQALRNNQEATCGRRKR